MRYDFKQKWPYSRGYTACWKCQKLIRTHREAVLKAREYSRRIPPPFQFGEMNAYFCHYAQAWHIGHNGKRGAESAAYERMEWRWVNPFDRAKSELDDDETDLIRKLG